MQRWTHQKQYIFTHMHFYERTNSNPQSTPCFKESHPHCYTKNLVEQDREQCNAMQWKRSKYTRKMRYRKNFSFSYDIQTYEYISQHIITYACIPSAECISHSYSWSLMQSHIVSVSLEIWSQHAGARYPSYARSTPEICSSSRKRISRYLLAVTIVCNCIEDWCALCILF